MPRYQVQQLCNSHPFNGVAYGNTAWKALSCIMHSEQACNAWIDDMQMQDKLRDNTLRIARCARLNKERHCCDCCGACCYAIPRIPRELFFGAADPTPLIYHDFTKPL